MQVLRRPQFLLDLAEELTWLSDKAGVEVAEVWYDALKKTIAQLKRHPYLGRERKDLKVEGIRTWRLDDFPRWLIFYEVRDDNLVLYRIRQGTMNLPVLQIKS